MRFHRSLRRLTLLTAMLAIAAYAVAASSAAVALIALPAAVAAWWIGAMPVARLVPRIVINIGMLLIIVLAAAASLAGPTFGVEAVANLIVALILGKLFDWRNSRDAAQVLTLSVFLGVAAALTSLQLGLALLLIPFTPVVILSAMVYQVCAGQELAQQEAGRIAPPGAPAHGVGGAAGAGAAGHLRAVAALALVAILGVAVVVFILTPRGISPGVFAGMDGPAIGRRVDFASTVRLGRGGLLSESQRVVMDVEVTDNEGRPAGGPDQIFYLRGAVLGSYGDGVWTRSEQSVQEDKSLQGGLASSLKLRGQSESSANRVQRITLRRAGEGRPYLFAVQRPVEWRIEEPIALMWNQREGMMRVASEAPPQLTYTVVSTLTNISPRTEAALRDREAMLYAPAGAGFPSETVNQLTGQTLREAGLDPEIHPRTSAEIASIVHEIRRFLSTNYTYTLDVRRAEGEPIQWFLTEGRSGHCEYFASAMAAMCRSVGIDARVITGYLAAEYNEASGVYVVRESNAHAWVEVNHGDNQWRTHDPSPAADVRRIHRPEPTLMSRLRRWSDAIEHFWVTSVVTYDSSARSRLLGSDSGRQLAALGELEERVSRLREGGWAGLARAAIVGLGVAVAVFALLLAAPRALGRLRTRARRARAPGAPEAPQRESGLYRDLLVALSAAGAPKPQWRPVLTHARELAADAPALSEAAAGVAELYYRARFGARPLTEPEAASARERLRAMLEVVRENGSPGASPPSPKPPGR